MDKGFGFAPGFQDVAVELCAGEGKREGGRGLESEREREGVGRVAGAEHTAVEVEALFVEALFGKLSQLGVP